MKKSALIGFALYTLPMVAFAQDLGPLRKLVESFGSIVGILIPILIGLAIVVFFWGLVRYIWLSAGDQTAKESGKRVMIAGIVSLFVMITIYGIIEILERAFGIQDDRRIDVPQFPGSGFGGSGS